MMVSSDFWDPFNLMWRKVSHVATSQTNIIFSCATVTSTNTDKSDVLIHYLLYTLKILISGRICLLLAVCPGEPKCFTWEYFREILITSCSQSCSGLRSRAHFCQAGQQEGGFSRAGFSRAGFTLSGRGV